MDLKFSEWVVLLCFCAFGIQSSLAWVQQMREIEQSCAREGGFCINTHIPQPRRRANANRRGGMGGAGRRRGTRTRKGSRPDPRALGQQHTRLPASAQATAGVGAGAPAGGAGGAAPPAYGASQGGSQYPAQNNNNNGFFFGNSADPMNSLFGMMMFSRKKRQAPAMLDPAEIAEIPRRRKGQSMFNYLNAHCRKSEFDFGCRNTGGMCCLPFLK